MQGLREKLHNQRNRHIGYLVLVIIMVAWVIFRFASIAAEKNMVVFNATRDAIANGVPVETVVVVRENATLREPITIKNNRATVAASRVNKFAVGQKIGAGQIVSVSKNLDLDTGMHVIRTRGVDNGLQYALFRANGFLVPVHAVQEGAVMVVRDGVARQTSVTVLRQDADNAIVTSGLSDGDIVVVSHITDGAKVKVQK